MRKHNSEKSFTLIETLIVIAIMGILTSIVSLAVRYAVNRAHYVRMQEEMHSIGTALEMYLLDHNYKYPCDVNRGLPNGIEKYLSTGPLWLKPSWTNSEYDWDYWDPNPSLYPNPDFPGTNCSGSICTTNPDCYPRESIYQLSVRFCPLDNPAGCTFPQETWAQGFDYYSSVYYCIAGPCRAHDDQPYKHTGCCIGGACPVDQPKCE